MEEFAFCPVCGVALENARARKCQVCGADVQAERHAEAVEEAEFRGGDAVLERVDEGYSHDLETGESAEGKGETVPLTLSVIDREGLSPLGKEPPTHAAPGTTVRGYLPASGSSELGAVVGSWQKGGWVLVKHHQFGDGIWDLTLRHDPDAARVQNRRAAAIMISIATSLIIALAGLIFFLASGGG